MAKVRVGIIGFGGMGYGHAGYLVKGIEGAELTAVCDTSAERRRKAKDLQPALQLFETPEALFAAQAADAVLIATPHYDHPRLAKLAFQHGCHVLCEKPAGVYTKQVREMNAAAAQSGKVFALMFNQRALGTHQKMRELIQAGELGEVRRTNWIITDWFRSQAYYDSGQWRATWAGEGGGVLLNQCPHNLDLFQWIAGRPSRVFGFCAFGKYHQIEVEDEVTAYFEYPNGATGLFITTTGEAPGTNRFEVTGDNGKLVLERGKLAFFRNRIPASRFCRESPEFFAKPECWTCEIPIGEGAEGLKGHAAITQNWIHAILKGTPLLARGEEGLHSLEIANAILLSAWTGQWVNLPLDDELYWTKLQEKIAGSRFRKTVRADVAGDLQGSFGT